LFLSDELGFVLRRQQFPITLAFALTINKSQGQSVKWGLDLRIPCFAHGQLYVALSRSTSPHRVKAIFPGDSTATSNVVYPNALLPAPELWCNVYRDIYLFTVLARVQETLVQ
jgi:hypothetical protein